MNFNLGGATFYLFLNHGDTRMSIRWISRLCLGGLILLAGCDREGSTTSNAEGSSPEPGQVSVAFKLGPVGVLARASAMNPTKVVFTLTSSQSPTIRDTIILNGSTSGNKIYSLASQQGWTFQATGLDQRDSVLYSGSRSFTVLPKSNTIVSLALDARYSSMRVRFPVRDSLTRFVLTVDGRVWGDSSVAKQARVGDTIKMDRDYLSASPTGVAHTFGLRVFGQPWGLDTLLYSLDTSLIVQSGISAGRTLVLRWVGPKTPPPGQATLAVSLGSVGALDIGVGYQDTATVSTGPVPWSEAIVYGSLMDVRDGIVYRTVTIGVQTWMAENLNWAGSGVCLLNSADSCSKYGRLYAWTEAMAVSSDYINTSLGQSDIGQKGICPTGWHLPSAGEWNQLTTFVGGSATAAVALRSSSGWMHSLNGTDPYGFRALPGGMGFLGSNTWGNVDGWGGSWWSATEADDMYSAFSRSSYGADQRMPDGIRNLKYSRFSIRCVAN